MIGGLLVLGVLMQPAVDPDELVNCRPRPIAGTLGYDLARQAQRTNAQLYGAISFAERRLFNNEIAWGFETSVINNVIRVPTLGQGCFGRARYGMEGVDLYAASSGMAFPITPDIGLFYAGSITGSVMQHPSDSFWNNRTFTSYRYAALGMLATYVAPLAPTLNSSNGPTSVEGDFIVGAKFSIPKRPKLGRMYLAYAWSQGIFTNLNSEKLKILASFLLDDDFKTLALAKAGLDRLGLGDQLGKLSLYAQRRLIRGPLSSVKYDPDFGTRPTRELNDGALPWEQAGDTALSTFHLQSFELGGVVDLFAAYAITPKPFLHQAVAVYRQPLMEGVLLSAGAGVVQMPDLPWYGVEGGLKFTGFVGVGEVLRIGYNDVPTLDIFPFAQDATQISISLHFNEEDIRQ